MLDGIQTELCTHSRTSLAQDGVGEVDDIEDSGGDSGASIDQC